MGRVKRVLSVAAVCVLCIIVFACNPVELRTYLEKMTGFEGVIYINGQTGDDGNRGMRNEPLKTIQAGIDKAHSYMKDGLADSVEVHVSEGNYEVTNGVENVGDYINIVEGVSLYGGYSSDFSTKDSTLYVSKITDTTTGVEDTAAVRAYDGLTENTVIDGFTIQAGSGTGDIGSNALDIERASPTVTNNVILGGYATAGSLTLALDIYDNSSPIIEDNTITGGNSPATNIGIVISDSSHPIVRNNTITGGSVGRSTAVVCWNTQALIENNDIDGGSGTDTLGINIMEDCFLNVRRNVIHGGSATTSSAGILVQSDMVTIEGNRISGGSTTANESNGILCRQTTWVGIRNNTIFGGAASGTENAIGIYLDQAYAGIYNNTIAGGQSDWSAGIFLQNESFPSIENNIIFSLATNTRYCIYESSSNTGHASWIRNNDFAEISGSTVMYRPYTGEDLHTLVDMEALDYASGNWNEDPTLADLDGVDGIIATIGDNDWHLKTDSPIEVRQGGQDGGPLGWGYTSDMDGASRTNLTDGPNDDPSNDDASGWSMGAYERD